MFKKKNNDANFKSIQKTISDRGKKPQQNLWEVDMVSYGVT